MFFRKPEEQRRNRRAPVGGGRMPLMGKGGTVTFCPACRSLDVYPSHRRGWLEHGPLTWIGVLPFRCGGCQTRFYRFAAGDPRRRRNVDVVSPVDRSRAPRWHLHGPVVLTVKQDGEAVALTGETENVGFFGARVRIPQALPIGTVVRVSIEGRKEREGTVRWSRPHATAGYWHGIEFRTPLRGARGSRPYVLMRLRVLSRRVVLGALILFVMAVAAGTLVWVMDIFRNYDPKYYEPKDIERQQYQEQQQQEAPAKPRASTGEKANQRSGP